MRKWLLITTILLVMIGSVYGYDMCTDTKEINANCTMLTPIVTNCSTFNYSIINISGNLAAEGNLSGLNGDIYQFNVSVGKGDYIVRLCDDSTREIRVTDKQDDNKMILAAIILLPMIVGLFLMIWAIGLGADHPVFRIFLSLMSVLMFFVSLHFGLISVIKYFDFPELQNLIGSTTYWFGWVFAIMVTYFIIYAITKMFHVAAEKRKERLEF